jgi:hypothetical protein
MKILTYDPKKKKKVLCGVLEGEVFRRIVNPEKHFMKVNQSYGIQEDAFQEILSKGCKTIIMQTPTDKWASSIKDWIEHTNIADYNSGKQRFLGISYMHTVKTRYDFVGNKATIIEYYEK